MQILKIPNKILTSPAEVVTDFNYVAELFIDMKQVAIDNNLIGLAANQIGILKRVFIMNVQIPVTDNNINDYIPDYEIFINPKTKVNQAMGKSFDWEGCGSVPGVNALVERWKGLTITAQNMTGESFTMELTGILARCVQHEISHLNGILMTSQARQIKRIS